MATEYHDSVRFISLIWDHNGTVGSMAYKNRHLICCQLPRSGLRYDMATKERSACNGKEHDSFEII